MIQETILLVDDEANVLSSLSRELVEEGFEDIRTVQSGQAAMDILKDFPRLAVIVSDYHMPGMNGIEFFEQARKVYPDVSRIILTGVGDLNMAVKAVNRGSIFRFLLKPSPPDEFAAAVKDGVKQYRLINGERDLLNKTLSGSVKVMIDILAALSPDIFAQANRLRNLARKMSEKLNLQDQAWEMEVAALVCRIGAVTVPRPILEKWQSGAMLDQPEQTMVRSIPRISQQLINNIPRLENIAVAVGYQDCTYTIRLTHDSPKGDAIPLMARILKIILDYDYYLMKLTTPAAAYEAMLKREPDYDPRLLAEFFAQVIGISAADVLQVPVRTVMREREIMIGEVEAGMVISRDVYDRNGLLIVSKGTTITEVLRFRLINYARAQSIINPIFIEYPYSDR
jgi:response regulator RpfG family c-di-GMP phosphodiesterase